MLSSVRTSCVGIVVTAVLLLSVSSLPTIASFVISSVPLHPSLSQRLPKNKSPTTITRISQPSSSSSTSLNLLLDVPDGFFTITFPMLGILLSISKTFARIRMEENAWEQRLAEGRRAKLAQDPTLTDLDLRRMEAATEWSAYGPKVSQLQQEQQDEDWERTSSRRGARRKRTKVIDREDYDDYPDDNDLKSEYRMSDEEIRLFEIQYGVDYDPYYDDPYSLDDLDDAMEDMKYSTDKIYGDRIYDNGEVFYKDQQSGLYYRQGAKPRNLKLWN